MSNFKLLIGITAILSNWRDVSGQVWGTRTCWTQQAFMSHLYTGGERKIFYQIPRSSFEDCKNSCNLFRGCKILYYGHDKNECYKNIGPVDPFKIKLEPGGRFTVYMQHLCDDPNRYLD